MSDIMVSIRMPQSLLSELKESVKKEHFLDLSEQIRSIIRKKWIQAKSPELFELKKLREGIQEEIKKKSIIKIREEVNKELERIRAQLKEGELLK